MVYDIIIVGAGPAGLSTGLHLAQASPDLAQRTLILEKAHHPRPKLCAGGLLPGAEVCLWKLGLDLNVVPSVMVREVDLQFDGQSSYIRHKPFAFRAVRRDQFDAWLADVAKSRGLAIKEGVLVRRIRPDGDRITVLTDRKELVARAVVGADGSMSVVRRSIVSESASNVARAVEIQRPALPNRRPDRALLNFSWICDGVQGYVWDFPTPAEGRSMRTWGVYDSRSYRDLSRGSLKTVLEQGLVCHGETADGFQLEGHPLRWFHRRAVLSAPRVLLAGDAAGVDPVVGEGISFALGYGEVAAKALQDAFQRQDFSFADYRRRVMRHRIGRYLRRRVLAARLLYGVRSRLLYRTIWPLVGRIASTLLIDWKWEQ